MAIQTAIGSGGTYSGAPLSGAVRAIYSKEVLFQAQPNLVTAQFADKVTELGKEKGDTIKFTRYDDIDGSAKLSEVEPIQTTTLSSHQIAISVDEYGKAFSESERLLQTSWDNVMARATMLLGQHYGRTVDAMVQDEFRAAASLNTVIVGGGANRAALSSANTLSVKSIKDSVELLATYKAPKINGAYVCLVHPHCSRGLRDDSAWLDSHKYASPQEIFLGEIGMVEGVRFIETTFLPIIKASTGAIWRDNKLTTLTAEAVTHATLDTYQSLMLGGNTVGWAEALPVEFRDGGIIDFGRTHNLAWYSIMGSGVISENRSVLIESV